MILIGVFFSCFVLSLVNCLSEGDPCVKDDTPGYCTNIRNCQSALTDIGNKGRPLICGFDGSDPIVCCLDAKPISTPPPLITTQKTSVTTTTEYVPPVYDYKFDDTEADVCLPIAANLTGVKSGRKAWDKCIEYQESLIYPCEKSVGLTGTLSRGKYCMHNADELIVGGVDAKYGEFPHMALLGFGATPETAQWICGGTLISDKFVLTAGHCTFSREYGDVTFIRLSLLKRTDPINSSIKRLYAIKRIIKHPLYKPPSKYNDIALLETDTVMKLDQFAVPACIHFGDPINDEKAIATGWGAEKYRGSSANILQKVTLTKFTPQECNEKYPPARNFKNGFQEATQMCYGDKEKSKDTCQGDSGGPIQIKHAKIHCMYTVIGITSFGKACGFIGDPGVYTRVSAYAEWIEGIVWP